MRKWSHAVKLHDWHHCGRVKFARNPLIIGWCTAVRLTQLVKSFSRICVASQEVLESKSAMSLLEDLQMSSGATIFSGRRIVGGRVGGQMRAYFQSIEVVETHHSPIDLRGPEFQFMSWQAFSHEIAAEYHNTACSKCQQPL